MPRLRMLQSPPTRPLRLSALAGLGAIATSAVVVATTSPAYASSSGAFVSDANSARASHGLSGLSVASDLSSIAQQHAAAMARNQSLYHNSSLGSDVCCWSSIGENVGEGQSESQIESAFMNSAPHRENILSSSFTQIGVGTATDSHGTIWVDEVFRQPTGSSGAHHISTTHTTVHHSTTSSHHTSTPTVHQATVAHPVSITTLLVRRLRLVTRHRVQPRDPVAAAVGFAWVMGRLQH